MYTKKVREKLEKVEKVSYNKDAFIFSNRHIMNESDILGLLNQQAQVYKEDPNKLKAINSANQLINKLF